MTPSAVRTFRPERRREATALRRIVAATDFTPAAAMATRRAAQLAADAGARFEVLHVPTPASRIFAPLFGAFGGVAGGIAEHAGSVDADLVVLGNRGGSLLADLLRLNTAYRVRSRLGIPVLAVSHPAQGPYSRVLLAADLSPASAHAGRVARRLFPDAELHVLHACETPYEGLLRLADAQPSVIEDYRGRALQDAKRQLKRFAREAGLEQAVLAVRYGHPAAWIRRRALELGADLVVLRPAQSWLARGMASSVTEQVLNDPPCDALLVG